MSKFIILGEPWSNIIADANIEMIMATTVPSTLDRVENLANYLSSTHEGLFIRAYDDFGKPLLGILKPTPADLKEFVTHDTLVAQAGDILLEIENKEVQHMTLVKPDEADALYTALSEFLRNQDSNVFNVPIKKKKHDN
jgi:hypothetical protein